jgi:hypothetical protein
MNYLLNLPLRVSVAWVLTEEIVHKHLSDA